VPKQLSVKLTRLELEVMEILWRLGQAAVREAQEALPAAKRPAYTTVQTIIRRLEQKGAVRQVKKIGNAFVYAPAITRQAAHRRLIDEFLAVFGGSARPLLAYLVEAGKLRLEDVREIERLLDSEGGETETPRRRNRNYEP